MTDMTPEQRIDAALDSVLRASGTSLKHYMPGTQEAMRHARGYAQGYAQVMTDSHIKGSNDCHKAMAGGRR